METKKAYETKSGQKILLTDTEADAWEKGNLGKLKVSKEQPEQAKQPVRVTQGKADKAEKPVEVSVVPLEK